MKSPFKFLDSYTKEDRDIFFGREREKEELYHRVFESKIMLVYGVSGTGKSSLIHCGLANKFQETDWLPLVIRRGGNILENLAAAIRSASITPQGGEITTPLHFKKAVRSLYLDHYKPVFFIFDQFEELFIFGNKEEKRSFIQTIKTIVESDIQCRFIFVMREEYMASFTEFERFVPTIFQNRVRIEKMSHINALEAIKGPCKYAGIDIEEGFAETLLEKLSPESADVELTYLQVFLDRILKLAGHAEDKIRFTTSLISKIGNISDLLGGFLDEQIALMDDPDMAMAVLKSFVSSRGTKRPASENETMENVKSLGREISQEFVIAFIQSFVRLRVLRDKDDQGRYELRHDSLAEKIFEKFSLAEKELIELKQFIENAYQIYLRRNVLLNSDDITYISNRDNVISLNEELKDFLLKSRKNQSAMKRTLRRLVTISAIAALTLVFTVGFAIYQKTKISNSTRSALESIAQFKNPVDRLCLATEAWETDNSENAKGALLEAFNYLLKYQKQDPATDSIRKKYLIEFTPVTSHINFAGCSKDGKFIYGYSSDSIIIWNYSGTINSRFKASSSPIISLKMSDNSDYLGGVTKDSTLTIWSIDGSVRFNKHIRYNPLNQSQIFRFTKENNILTLSMGNDAELIDTAGKSIQTFRNHKGDVNALDISKDGEFFATASSDSTINIWYKNNETNNFDQYNTLAPHHDTVLSVGFAPNNRYVISASKDRSVRVTSINNDNVWTGKEYIDPGYWSRKERIFPVITEFDSEGSGIRVISFRDGYSGKEQFMFAGYFDRSAAYFISDQKSMFDYISFSPDRRFIAYVSEGKTVLATRMQFRTSVYSFVNNYKSLELQGTAPFFSIDGKYVFTIQDNHIESWYTDFRSIAKIGGEYHKKWPKYL